MKLLLLFNYCVIFVRNIEYRMKSILVIPQEGELIQALIHSGLFKLLH